MRAIWHCLIFISLAYLGISHIIKHAFHPARPTLLHLRSFFKIVRWYFWSSEPISCRLCYPKLWGKCSMESRGIGDDIRSAKPRCGEPECKHTACAHDAFQENMFTERDFSSYAFERLYATWSENVRSNADAECLSAPKARVNFSPDRNDDSLAAIIVRMCQMLPVELASEIWGFLPPCFARLMIAHHAFCSIATQTPVESVNRQSAILELVGTIVVYTTIFYERAYICGLQVGDKLYGHRSTNQTSVTIRLSIAAVATGYGAYGVQWIKLLFEDQSEAILGSVYPVAKYTGMGHIEHHEERAKLNVWWDGFKFTHVELHRPRSQHGADFLWDSPIGWSQPNYVQMQRHFEPTYFFHYHEFTRPRYMKSLAVVREGYALRGLTVFCSLDGGMSAIGTHFDSLHGRPAASSWIGQRSGIPLHFQFCNREKIYADFSIYRTHPHMPDIGVLFAASKPPPSAEPPESITTPLVQCLLPNVLMWAHFNSRAVLKDIRGFRTLSCNQRCIGMVLSYWNGSEQYVGQWADETDAAVRVTRYTMSFGMCLRFWFREVDGVPPEPRPVGLIEAIQAVDPMGDNEDLSAPLYRFDIKYHEPFVWRFSEELDCVWYQ
ncbi:hypothetical protein BO71DRAFT_426399 [Aspergillus ellipticus CBS 707.79]|uniref:Uncharacterized protein n=1 Tax=Aspergillus ellipticus CBS 707.79 TaxID=1448320 RepID=A0A319DKX0_9EURO|nr:hypothetical protein BO71DRAFT_426399 [Aspergillus ellipticus CBS 707.79]